MSLDQESKSTVRWSIFGQAILKSETTRRIRREIYSIINELEGRGLKGMLAIGKNKKTVASPSANTEKPSKGTLFMDKLKYTFRLKPKSVKQYNLHQADNGTPPPIPVKSPARPPPLPSKSKARPRPPQIYLMSPDESKPPLLPVKSGARRRLTLGMHVMGSGQSEPPPLPPKRETSPLVSLPGRSDPPPLPEKSKARLHVPAISGPESQSQSSSAKPTIHDAAHA